MVAMTRVGGHFGVKTKKCSGLINRCDLTDTRQEVDNQMSDQLWVICISPIIFNLLAATNRHFNVLSIRVGSDDPNVPNSMKTALKFISVELQEVVKGAHPTIMLLESELFSMYPPACYLSEDKRTYASLINGVLKMSHMREVHARARAQVHMRGSRLFTREGAVHPETRVVTVKKRVVIMADWNKIMHTDASDRVISVTKHLTLEDALTDSAVVVHPDSVEDLLSHLEQIHQCNALGVVSRVVRIDTESDASSKA